jgi:DNA-binding FrmR family transcriptional regulator
MADQDRSQILEHGYLAPEDQAGLVNRLARLEGHVRAIRQMVVERRCADEILLQVAAVKAGVNAFAAELLEHELRDCVASCMAGTPDERLAKVSKSLAALLKRS